MSAWPAISSPNCISYRHRSRCFGQRVRRRNKRRSSARDLERAEDEFRSRNVGREADGAVALPVLVASSGHRAALDFTVSIRFYRRDGAWEQVRIRDVRAESLNFNLGVADVSRLENAKQKERLQKGPPIAAAYDYMSGVERIEDWGRWRLRVGEIVEAGSYGIVYITADISDDADEFYLFYNVSCSDGWMRDETFMQRFCVTSRDDK